VSTFAVEATLIHPEHRDREVTAELLVDTGAFYSLLPAEIIERLGLEAEEDFEEALATDGLVVHKLGEVRIRLDGRERTTIFVVGPSGCSPLLGSVTLGAFALTADPRHQRLVPGRLVGHV
jgi:clan AA aspartic protease